MIGNILKAGVICLGFSSGYFDNPSVIISNAQFNDQVQVAYLNCDSLLDTPNNSRQFIYYNFDMELNVEDLDYNGYEVTPFDYLHQISGYDDVFFGFIKIPVLVGPLPTIQRYSSYLPILFTQTFTFNNTQFVCDGMEVVLNGSSACYVGDYNGYLTDSFDTTNESAFFGLSFGLISSSISISSSSLVSNYIFIEQVSSSSQIEFKVLCNYSSSVGYLTGYQNGVNDGYNQGYQQGVGTAQQGTFLNLFNSIADTPLRFIYGLFSFDLFGTSMLVIILSLLTGIVLFGVVKKFWK